MTLRRVDAIAGQSTRLAEEAVSEVEIPEGAQWQVLEGTRSEIVTAIAALNIVPVSIKLKKGHVDATSLGLKLPKPSRQQSMSYVRSMREITPTQQEEANVMADAELATESVEAFQAPTLSDADAIPSVPPTPSAVKSETSAHSGGRTAEPRFRILVITMPDE